MPAIPANYQVDLSNMEPADEHFDERSDDDGESDGSEEEGEDSLYLFNLVKPESKEAAVWSTLNLHPFGLTSWSSDSVEAMKLKLVRKAEDLNDDAIVFKPEMTYQVFGEKEIIAGYKDLQVELVYGAGSLRTLLKTSYATKVDPDNFEPENIEEKLKDRLQTGYFTSVDNFTIGLNEEEDNFKPPGVMINQFSINTEEGEQTYEVYYANVVDHPKMFQYCERMQTFILWYIEAASFVELDDPKWNFFLMFEKYRHDGKSRHAFAGFVSTYDFYCYPDNIRPRVSQMLVLPPFQGAGLGAELLSSVFVYYRAKSSVADIAVESPSPEFQRLRDYVDCKACSTLPEFAPKHVKRGLSKAMEAVARDKLKMSKKQALRVCNILRLKACNQSSAKELEKYVECLKEQADKQNQRAHERAEKKGLMKLLEREQLVEALPSLSPEFRLSSITQAANDLLKHFQQVVKRLEGQDD